MERRRLGKSQITIAPIGLGTWAMGGGTLTGSVDDRESIAALHAALDLGIALVDTAPSYGAGHAEEVVGKALRGRRQDVVLATKCGLVQRAGGDDPPRRDLTRDSILRECEASLRRLRVDAIDLYQCHWPDPETPIRETMGALNLLVERDMIRAIGLSNYSSEQLREAMEYGPIHAVQLPFSILQPRAALDLIPFCAEHGIAVLAYSPLAKGLLTGKFRGDETMEGARARDPDFLGNRFHRNLRTIEAVREVAARSGKSLGQLALNWVANYPGVTCALMGAKRPTQVADNAVAAEWSLTESDRLEINRIVEAQNRER